MNGKPSRRKKIHLGIRKKVRGSAAKPRISIFRSNKSIYAQAVDDLNGHTIVAASSKNHKGDNKIAIAKEVGKEIAEKLLANNINTAVFDRAGYLYHGRVKSIADGAREAGLKI